MVYFPKLSAAALLLPLASSAPVISKRQALTDADILQFALTLEHLENVFYQEALKMPESEFVAAGFSAQYYDNLKYISMDETQHVIALTQGLQAAGATPVAACEYDFGFTDPKSFVAFASILEGVGTAAYLGAAPSIMSKEYLTIAGSILTTEAIHTAVQRLALNEIAPANPYGSYLGPNQVYTLAAAFITSCPSTNPTLPFKAFPSLMATQGIPSAPGLTFTFSTTATLPSTFYATFVNGLVIQSQPATFANGMVTTTIPATVSGQTYVILTNANTTAVTDAQTIAGPAILEVTPNAPIIGGVQ